MIRVSAICLVLASVNTVAAQPSQVLVEDFSYPGAVPTKWRILQRNSQESIPLPFPLERDDDYSEVVTVEGEQMLRIYTRDETEQIGRINGEDGFNWDITIHPILSWRWRADALPEGARETSRSLNDTGAAIYVVFDCKDWLRRPCTLKYTYSSTLDVGTTASYGKLRAIVVSTANEGLGQWITVTRNIRDDFREEFGTEAHARPLFIMVWGDSDNTGGISDAYFDKIVISAER